MFQARWGVLQLALLNRVKLNPFRTRSVDNHLGVRVNTRSVLESEWIKAAPSACLASRDQVNTLFHTHWADERSWVLLKMIQMITETSTSLKLNSTLQ